MLHIILGILKFIGILLAVLFLLLILIILSVLFVPVQYRAKIVKNESEMNAQARITWLLHLISVTVSYDIRNRETCFFIQIFGVSLDRIKNVLKKLSGIKNRKKSGSGVEKSVTDWNFDEEETEAFEQHDEITEEIEAFEQHDEITEEIEAFEQHDEITEEVEAFEQHDETIEKTEDSEQDDEILEELKESYQEFEASEESDSKIGREENSKISFSKKLLYQIRNICDKIKGIPEKINYIYKKIIQIREKLNNIYEKIMQVPKKINNICEKIMQIPEKITAFMVMLEDYEVKVVAGDVWKELKYILGHYGPRRAKGFLHFGTGDPAKTGQLTGFLYVILPVQADRLEIRPEFNESVLETDLIIKGHIRAVHLLPVGWKLLRNKKLMRLIKKIRMLR